MPAHDNIMISMSKIFHESLKKRTEYAVIFTINSAVNNAVNI